MNAINCPECGKEIPGNFKFCPECGAKLAAVEDEGVLNYDDENEHEFDTIDSKKTSEINTIKAPKRIGIKDYLSTNFYFLKKRKIVVISIGVIIILVCVIAGTFKFVSYSNYEKGMDAINKGNYDLAIECFNKSNGEKSIQSLDIANSLKKSEENYALGMDLYNKKEYDAALAKLTTIGSDSPKYEKARELISECNIILANKFFQEAQTFYNEKKYNDANNSIQEALTYDSGSAEALTLQSQIVDEKNKVEAEEKARAKVEAEKAAQDRVRSIIRVTKLSVSKPNSAGGVDLFIGYKNMSDKVIKYATFTITPYNKVGDAATCEIRGNSTFNAQDEGPHKKGEGISGNYNWYWENAWYNWTISTLVLDRIYIEYMDGTEETIMGNDLKYVQF